MSRTGICQLASLSTNKCRTEERDSDKTLLFLAHRIELFSFFQNLDANIQFGLLKRPSQGAYIFPGCKAK